MALYVTSDRHFLHKNMTKEGLDFSGRGYETMYEMTEALILAHNKTVSKNDTTIDLGDLSMHGSPQDVFEIYSRMNGNFIIVKGNHDNQKMLNYFNKNNFEVNGKPKFVIHDVGYRFKQDGKIFYCTHYPMQVGERGKVFSIHGHIHEFASPYTFGVNVGIDSPEIRGKQFGAPLLLSDVVEYLETKVQNIELTKYKID